MAAKARQQYYADGEYIDKQAREFQPTMEFKAKIDSIEPGAQVNIIEDIKVNGTSLEVDDKTVDISIPLVIDNLYSTDGANALSAKQGKVLYDLVQNLASRGRYLSNWNAATGLPTTNPVESHYQYRAGDYYVVSNVAAQGGTNYRPEPGEFVIGQASVTVETEIVKVTDMYLYDGTNWNLLINSTREIAIDSSLSTSSTNPVENRVVTNAINGKQDTLVAGNNIQIANDGKTISATDTTYTAGANISIDANNEISATDTTYTAGANVQISNSNVISATDTTYSAGDGIDITNNEISVDTSDLAGTGLSTDNSNNLIVDTTVIQEKLVSGTNIKTVNNNSLLGSGNIDIPSGKNDIIVSTTAPSDTDVIWKYAYNNGSYYDEYRYYNGSDWVNIEGITYSSSAPYFSNNDYGRLWYDESNSVLKYYDHNVVDWVPVGGIINSVGTGLSLSSGELSADTTVLATKTDLSGKQDKATSGSTAPSTTPSYVGQQYIDTTADKMYVATGTSSSSDWTEVGAGSGDMLYADFNWVTKTGATITLDLRSEITPSTNFTVNKPSTLEDGQYYILRVTSGATAYTMTLGTNVTNPYSEDLTLEASTVQQFTFLAKGGNLELQPSSAGVVYTAGTGITISNDEISADTTVLALKSDLANYYTKTETYTKTEVDNLISNFGNFEVVASLPPVSTASEKTIYLLGPIGTGADKYEEWIVTKDGDIIDFTYDNGHYTPSSITIPNNTTITASNSERYDPNYGDGTITVGPYFYQKTDMPSSGWFDVEEGTPVSGSTSTEVSISAGTYSISSIGSTPGDSMGPFASITLSYGAGKQWTKIGETSMDLSNYVTSTQLATTLQDYATTTQLATKQDTLTAGTGITISNDEISADTDVIQEKLTAGEGISIGEGQICVEESDRKGPASSGFHVPSKTEWQGLKTIMDGLSLTTGDAYRINLHIPFAGRRYNTAATLRNQGSIGYYWSSSPRGSANQYYASSLYLDSSDVIANDNYSRAHGFSVRTFKNVYVVPNSSWIVIQGTLGSAGIFWNQAEGLISITSDGTTGYTIQDKNLGATTVYSDGDTLTQDNMGNMYQWGNNYGFPSTGTISNTSSTQVDASSYGPGNYYESDTYITISNDWSSVQNDNLWGDTSNSTHQECTTGGPLTISADTTVLATKTDLNSKQDTLVSGTNIKTINNESLLGSGNITISAPTYTAGDGIDIDVNNEISIDTDVVQEKVNAGNGINIGSASYRNNQGPCPDGFHVPTKVELQNLKSYGTTAGAWAADGGSSLSAKLNIPLAGALSVMNGNPVGQGTLGVILACDGETEYSTVNCYSMQIAASMINVSNDMSGQGYNVRPFKDTPVAPDSSWTVVYQGTGSAGVFHNTTLGLISISGNGTDWITLSDKNVGATVVWNSGDTLSADNVGNFYQWGNNYGFPFAGASTTSSTQVDATGYGPGNYYSSDTFITDPTWQSSTNLNLWGGVNPTGTWTQSGVISNTGVLSFNGNTGSVNGLQISPNSPLTPKYVWYGTQAQYDALSQYYTDEENDTVYFTI